ncbi:MAG: hypothetical protein IT260_10135 [Saprospiraceae bacterium]|nr:hypothetical protein [Saprospiraceae bacterium]
MSSRLLAVAGVLLLFALVWLYTREFRVFTNTIGMRGLLWGSLLVGALAGAGMLYRLRRRLTPWDLHLPEVFTILIFSILSMPLLASLLNRAGGKVAHESFVFVSEQPYISSNYGLLKGEKIKASGYRLQVKEGQRLLRFQYKSQPYFPLSKPGDEVLLPVRRGLLGVRVMEME